MQNHSSRGNSFLRGLRIGMGLFGAALIVFGLSVWWTTWAGYRLARAPSETPLDPYLRLFSANISQHAGDPVAGCWYDAGDYVVFLPNQLLATWYLIDAHSVATEQSTKDALNGVIAQSMACLRPAMAGEWKQFRDAESHGIPVPPQMNEIFFPQNSYRLAPSEGRDMWTIWREILVLTNATIEEIATADAQIHARTARTQSEGCCEAGPLMLSDTQVVPFDSSLPLGTDVWGGTPQALARVDDQPDLVRDLLHSLMVSDDPIALFEYWGGNRDIAGTVVLEKAYEAKTGDATFAPLAQQFMSFLREGNATFPMSFDNDKDLYHPCRFFAACSVSGTLAGGLVSGADDPWELHEPTILGQAEYVNALVRSQGW